MDLRQELVKTENSEKAGAIGEGECGDDVAGLLVRERQSSEFGYCALHHA